MKEESMGEELRRVCCYVGNFWQKEIKRVGGMNQWAIGWVGMNKEKGCFSEKWE